MAPELDLELDPRTCLKELGVIGKPMTCLWRLELEDQEQERSPGKNQEQGGDHPRTSPHSADTAVRTHGESFFQPGVFGQKSSFCAETRFRPEAHFQMTGGDPKHLQPITSSAVART